MGTKETCCLVEVASSSESSMVRIGVDRIRDYFPGTVDIVHRRCDDSQRSRYDLVVIMAAHGEREEVDAAWGDDPPGDGDAFLVKTVGKAPLVVAAGGVGCRGTMFAAYRLADLMEMQADLSSVDIRLTPRVPYRYGWIDRWTHAWTAIYQPTVYGRTLKELPRYGVNGVFLGLPVTSDLKRYARYPFDREGADLYPRETEVFEWKEMIKQIKAYGYDIWAWMQPIVPPEFDIADIDRYYRGEISLSGYERALKTATRKFLTTLLAYFPEIDLLEFNTSECPDFWPMKRLFCYPQDDEVCARVLGVYLETLTEVCRKSGKRAACGTHCCGISSSGIRAMHEVVFRYPDMMLIEDDYCDNNLWLAGPLFGYLPHDLKPGNHLHKSLGIRGIADAEFFGEGRLPSAAPGPLARSGAAARDFEDGMYSLRVNHCTGTPSGTSLDNINAIMFIAGMAQCWDPVRDTDELWRDWAVRRFGAQAAEILLPALKECEELLTKGFSLQGLDVLWGWNIISEKWLGELAPETGNDWVKGEAYGPGHNLFGIFQRPGIPLTPKREGDLMFFEDLSAYQCGSKSVPISQVRADQQRASDLIQKGMVAVEEAKSFLGDEDYSYLHGIYDTADVVLKAVMLCSEAAYATQIMLDNYDGVPDPEQQFERAIADLESGADEVAKEKGERFMSGWTGISLCRVLHIIAEGYRAKVK